MNECKSTLSITCIKDDEKISMVSKGDATSSEGTGVSVDGLAASWTMEPDKLVLSDISFSVNKVSHIIVCTYHVTS